MESTSTTILFILLTGSISNCFPVLETDDVNTGNWLNDEFVDESISTSLADPIDIKGFIAFPRLDLHLQPPAIDFQAVFEESPVEDYSNSESLKDTIKKSVTPPSGFAQPSRYLEPPVRGFGSNPKKTVSTYFSVYSPLPLLKTLKTPSSSSDLKTPSSSSLDLKTPSSSPLDLIKHRTVGFGSYGSTVPQRLALPMIVAPLPLSTSLLKASPRSLQTQSQTAGISEVKGKDHKKSMKPSLKDMKLTKKTKPEITKSKEGTTPLVRPEFDEPTRILLPPTGDFAIQVSKILMSPTGELAKGNSA